MLFEKTNRISGELLRNLRESQSIDIALLARQVNLSVAQLRQLESDQLTSGERALFYSETIKANAARKVALALGADLNDPVVTPVAKTASVNNLTDMQVMEDLAQLLQKQERARRVRQRRDLLQSKLLWSGLVLCILATLVWHFQNPLLAQGRGWIVAAEAALPVAAPSVLSASEPVAVDTPVAATSEITPDVSLAEGLCAHKVSAVALKASMPSKAGKSVHLVADADAAVCMQDATGTKFVATLKAKEARSFYGVAPWTVHFDNASAVQLFFQGQRMRWPEDEQNSFTLQEVPGAY